MTSVLLDANELQQDWLCASLRFQLVRHRQFYPPLSFYVPALVVDEVVANHARAVAAVQRDLNGSERKLKRLGVTAQVSTSAMLDYRHYLLQRFDEVLGISILDWPDTPHEVIVQRAVSRIPPFNERGGGYRDTLIWMDVLRLAEKGDHVVLVSADSAFGRDGALSEPLQAEVDGLSGEVELVSDFGKWLLGRLPWKLDALDQAVRTSRNAEFEEWFLASDFQSDLEPSMADLGFRQNPVELEIVGVEWDGLLDWVGDKHAEDGLVLVEYDIGQSVEFLASFAEGTDVSALGEPVAGKWVGTVGVTGTVEMVVRVGVVFDADYWGVEELAWRRADGVGPGAALPVSRQDPNLPRLF